MTDPRTLPERYSTAVNSDDLTPYPDRRCDIDMLIADGWIRSGLGTQLYRLRAEYDAQRAGIHRAQIILGDLRRQAAEARRLGHMTEAQAIDDDLTRQELTERVMLLIGLKSLGRAKQALGAHAIRQAARRRNRRSDGDVHKIVGAVLDAWLDPLCHTCGGTGSVGVYGEARSICRRCGGSGRRKLRLAKDDDGHQFGSALLADMDRKTDYVLSQWRRFLRLGGAVRRV